MSQGWICGPWYGVGAKRMREENVPENAPSPKTPQKELVCSVVDFCTRKTEQWHLRGVEKVPDKGRSAKTLFWEGCPSWEFPPSSPKDIWILGRSDLIFWWMQEASFGMLLMGDVDGGGGFCACFLHDGLMSFASCGALLAVEHHCIVTRCRSSLNKTMSVKGICLSRAKGHQAGTDPCAPVAQ